ncbi:rho GTPase-activating protein 18-like isoform X2 [Lineus longissimus]|uniref:rho GTPase-activating protein 18-like isoform X2 n=1 Tax=Lineus longissimus TaxID=88925 RepID=UPI002B4DC1A9
MSKDSAERWFYGIGARKEYILQKRMADSTSPTGEKPAEFEEYWNEVKDIEENKEPDDSTDEDTSLKTPDEGEIETKWLNDAGYGHLVQTLETDGDEPDGDVDELINLETSSLTRTQAAAVKRRVNTLHQTMKKKRKDIRNVFDTPVTEDDAAPTTHKPTRVNTTGGGKHARHQSGKKSDVQIGKNKDHQYNLGDTIADDATAGIEMISIHSTSSGRVMAKNNKERPPLNMPTISDADVTFDFKSESEKRAGGTSPSAPTQPKEIPSANKVDETDDLPNFILVKDKLGTTHIGDLSAEDLDRVRSLALIELTALFDSHSIMYSCRKPKKKFKETGQFGVPLNFLMENDRKRDPKCKVPILFGEIIEYLDKNCLKEEGILRIPGSASRIKNVRQQIEDNFANGGFSWDDVHSNDVAALLKQFLRDLPHPLLTYEYVEAFAGVEQIPDKKQQLQALNLLVALLPEHNRNSLKLLLRFLKRVVDHHHLNKMTIANCAMIIAPNLFLINQAVSTAQTKKVNFEISMAAGTSNIIKMMIKYQDILWTIPSFLLQQIRHQYESEQMRKYKDKSLMKLLKKDKSDVYKKPSMVHESDFQEGLINVQAPGLSKAATAIQLDENMTAGDIVAKFKPRGSKSGESGNVSRSLPFGCINLKDVSFAEENAYLFEIGGNIGERCLDPNSNMLTIFKTNPNAEWVIRNVEQLL